MNDVCPDCNGTGRYEFVDMIENPDVFKTIPCELCNGTGRREVNP